MNLYDARREGHAISRKKNKNWNSIFDRFHSNMIFTFSLKKKLILCKLISTFSISSWLFCLFFPSHALQEVTFFNKKRKKTKRHHYIIRKTILFCYKNTKTLWLPDMHKTKEKHKKTRKIEELWCSIPVSLLILMENQHQKDCVILLIKIFIITIVF